MKKFLQKIRDKEEFFSSKHVLAWGGVLVAVLVLYSIGQLSSSNPRSPEIGYYSLSPKGAEGGAILPASGESYFEASYEAYYQAQYESNYQSYYQGLYESSYQSYYQSQYESTYQGGYESYYQSQYESTYQSYYQSYYQGQYEAAYQGYYQSYYQGYYQASYCSSNQGQVCTSPANSCGAVNYGTYSCAGVCSSTVAPAETACVPPGIVVDPAAPSIVINKGASCSFSWTATNATSCTVTGPGVSTTGTSGSVSVPNVTQSSTYTVKCYNGATVNTTKTVNCRVNPTFREI